MPLDYRTLAAAVLGVGLGVVLVAFPEGVIRVQLVGRVPGNRRGEYGSEDEYGDRILLAVRGIGVLVALAGVFFGAQAFGVV